MVCTTLRWRGVDSNHQYRVTPPRFREGVISAPLDSHQPKGSTNESRHHGNAGGSCAVLMVRIRLPPADSPSLTGSNAPRSRSPAFRAGVRDLGDGAVGRDEDRAAIWRLPAPVSLLGQIPVPQCQ